MSHIYFIFTRVSSITRKIRLCNVEYCCKNVFKISKKKFRKRKKNGKIYMDSAKLINSFEIIYGTIISFGNFVITFWHSYHAKYMFFTYSICLIFFRIFVISQSTEILIVSNFWLRVELLWYLCQSITPNVLDKNIILESRPFFSHTTENFLR